MILLDILFSVIFPVFLIIGVGVALDRCFKLDLPTLSKLNFYVFVPALVFVKLLDADLPGATMLKVGLFTFVHILLVFGLSWLVFSGKGLRDKRPVLSLGAMF